jgi:tRNA uridine 5-carboxymethylaminomethyl modification enzyme
VILATGTYLGSRVFVSDRSVESGPSGFASAALFSKALKEDGFELRRFKTGTPARVHTDSLNYEKMTEQPGEDNPAPFSYLNDEVCNNKVSCWLTYTNPDVHEIVSENLEKTAPYGGYTTGVGTRYCLSIEDKVSRFPDRARHQIFLEPEGMGTDEVYVQGMSTSLPEELQEKVYRKIPGLENAIFLKYAYSIEYECLDPLTLTPALEYMGISGLFCAGQINGTSGYEEAAAQGLMAGINAARSIDGQPPFILSRSEAYIGVLIDDLVTKGTNEPYRIMTSRAEFRLFLRQDNADLRLTEKGYEIGLASQERYERYLVKKNETEAEIKRLKETKVAPEKANGLLSALGGAPVSAGVTLAELLARPEVSYDALIQVDESRSDISKAAGKQAEIEIKYKGYIEKQVQQIAKFEKLEKKRLPENLDYAALEGLRLEARQKLAQIRPISLGQAARISGVSPADVSVLMVHLAKAKT